jgi:hypothetical protein
MTEPTVAPRPRCASGISARCGWTNGIVAVVIACARVLSSRIEAQFHSFGLICSIVLFVHAPAGALRAGHQARPIDRA